MLLRRHRKTRIVQIDQWGGIEEHERHILQRPKMRRRREDHPERQPSHAQPGLHGWSSDLESEFQRPVRPDEIVITAKAWKGVKGVDTHLFGKKRGHPSICDFTS